MTKADLKTKPQKQSVAAFLNAIDNDQRRKDAKTVDKLMRDVTGKKPVLWGGSIVGYGSYHYVYDSGREGDWMVTGFSPRKANLVVYIMPGFSQYQQLMNKLGKVKTGKSCLYINKLDDIDLAALKKLVAESVKAMSKKYKCR